MQTGWCGGFQHHLQLCTRRGACFSSTTSQRAFAPFGTVLSSPTSVDCSAIPIAQCHHASPWKLICPLAQCCPPSCPICWVSACSAALKCKASPGASPALWHSIVLQVAQLLVGLSLASAVLPHNHVIHADGVHVAQHLDLLIADVLCIQADLQGRTTKNSGATCCCDIDGHSRIAASPGGSAETSDTANAP